MKTLNLNLKVVNQHFDRKTPLTNSLGKQQEQKQFTAVVLLLRFFSVLAHNLLMNANTRCIQELSQPPRVI